MKRAVDHEGDAVHDARFFQRHQQQHQRDHVRHDDSDETDQTIEHAAGDDTDSRYRLPARSQGEQAGGSHRIDPGTDFEDYE